ncbi:hypothetical protein KM043_000035, partial [Ampulex compressa]
ALGGPTSGQPGSSTQRQGQHAGERIAASSSAHKPSLAGGEQKPSGRSATEPGQEAARKASKKHKVETTEGTASTTGAAGSFPHPGTLEAGGSGKDKRTN